MASAHGPGPVPLTAQREQYALLIASGVKLSAGVELAAQAAVLRYLSEDERVMIGDLRLGGATLRVIGAELGRSPATVSRELRRNLDPKSEQYRAFAAHQLDAARRSRPRARRVDKDAELGAFVLALLRKRWSPEQISWALRVEFSGVPSRQLSTESVYLAVYDSASMPTRTKDCVLRTRRRRRRPHRHPNQRRQSHLPAPMAMIDQRPDTVEDRVQAGHWEGTT